MFGAKLYLNKDGIISDFFSKMSIDTIRDAAAIPDDQLIQYHHTTGRMIRNQYHLWDEDNAFTNPQDPESELHPDNFSFAVMQGIVQRCREWVQEND